VVQRPMAAVVVVAVVGPVIAAQVVAVVVVPVPRPEDGPQ